MEATVLRLLLFWVTLAYCDKFYPVTPPLHVRRFNAGGSELERPRFRSLIVDEQERVAYVGAQSAIFKLSLSSDEDMLSTRRDIPSKNTYKPSFPDKSTDREWWTTVGYEKPEFHNYSPIKDILGQFEPNANIHTYQSLNLKNRLDNYLRDIPFGSVFDLEGNAVLETTQQYATIYQSANLTFKEHCIRQAKALSLYYGRDLQMNVEDYSLLCDIHIRGMTLIGGGKLFAIKTGIFGTMPVSVTGTNRYEDWLRYQAEIQPFLTCLFNSLSSDCYPTSSIRSPFNPENYNGIVTDPSSKSDPDRLPDRDTYLMPSPENHLGKLRHCDNRPAPNRLILSASDLRPIKYTVLVGQVDRESCAEGALAQIFLGGYHPDQKTFSHFSSAGNGPMGDKQAIYILTEIGQEKQLDLMREYLNLPEIYPLSSSASLAMVRVLVNSNGDDIDPGSIVISNPFKHNWVTSPLNRFGRLNKAGSQDQVAYTPKPVALHEDSEYIYFFFREADWENTPVPSYDIRRHHHSLNSYTHALYFPWEKSFIDRKYMKFEESPADTHEELYAPKYMGWQHANDNLKVTGRVARVSKNDAGLPMGLQDVNLFDLDHKLSLTTFQTFVKSRLTCRVPVADSDPTNWPGHGQPFGHVGSKAHEIEKMEGNVQPKTFINRYVSKGIPVVLQGLLANSPGLKTWDSAYLRNAPPAAMTNISVYDGSTEELIQYTTSMRNFIKMENEDLFMFDQIPSFLMKDLAFPQIFKCDVLLSSLQKHFMTYHTKEINTEVINVPLDELICPVFGKASFILVPTESWELSSQDKNTLDYSAVDYTTHPWLKDLQYHTALHLSPGDCIYLPRQWYLKITHESMPSSSVAFTWKGEMTKVSKHSCGKQDLTSQHHLTAFSSHFAAATAQRDTVMDALIHYFVFYLGDHLASSFSSKQFVRKQRRDDKLFTKLVDWDAAVEEISAELFEILDVSGDGRFSLADVEYLDYETRDSVLSQIQDRLQDFGAIMDQQQKLKKQRQAEEMKKNAQQNPETQATSKKTTPSSTKTAAADDMSTQFKEELQKEMDKLLKELEISEQAKNREAATANKRKAEEPQTREEIKRKAKASAKKAQAKPKAEKDSAPSKEKYKVVDEEEIEIVAEDDEDNGKEKRKTTKVQSNSGKGPNSQQTAESKVSQPDSKTPPNKQNDSKTATNQQQDSKTTTNQQQSSKKPSEKAANDKTKTTTKNKKGKPSAKKDEL